MDDQEFWDRAFLGALPKTMQSFIDDARNDDSTHSWAKVAGVIASIADAALTARQERMKPTPQEKTEP